MLSYHANVMEEIDEKQMIQKSDRNAFLEQRLNPKCIEQVEAMKRAGRAGNCGAKTIDDKGEMVAHLQVR